MTSHSAFSPSSVPSPPSQLPSQHRSSHQCTSHTRPTLSLSGAGAIGAHQIQPQQAYHHQIPVVRTAALTMSEAGDLAAAQLQEEETEDEESSISVELSNVSSSPDLTAAPHPHYPSPSPAPSSSVVPSGSIPSGCFYPIPSSPQSSSCCACSCHSHHQCYALPLTPSSPPITPSHLLPSPIPDRRRLPHWPHPHRMSKPWFPQPLSCPTSPFRTTQVSNLHTRSKSSTPLVCQHRMHMIVPSGPQTHAHSASELATAV